MAEEAQIVNRIVVQGIDEAKAQVQSLKQLLSEAKAGYEQARRSANEQGLFQGATQGADELKRIINEIQLQIKRLNTEISQGDFSTREKALNEELKIRQRISQQAEQQSARELADQQRLIEQMASGRERAMTQAASRESQMNTAQVARINSAAEQEMQARQKVLDYESTVRQKLAQQATKQAVVDSIGGVGSQASYAKQMSTLSANIEESYRAFQRGAIGSTEYTAALDKYTKGMSVAKAEQEAFSKSIGTYTNAWDRMRDRVASHASWIMAGTLIGAALAVPAGALDSIVRMDNAMAGMNQVMDHTNTAANAASKGISEQAEQQNMLNAESQKFLTIAAQYGESVDNIIKAGTLWGRLYKDVNIVNTLTAQSAKLAVADNFSLADANKAVESAMFQFGLTARNTSEALAYSGNVIDVWTKLAHNAGASAQDISQGVERAGSAAHQTGADFEFLSAQVATGVRATGRSGAEIGNMLKTLYGSFHSDKAIAELDKLGISVYKIGEDGTKQFRKAQDVMLDLSVTAQGTNQSLEETYKQIAGGKFQWSKAGATLGDYKEFIRTWGEAVNSMGFTDKQVGMQLDTISRRMQTLKTDVQSIAVSGGQSGITAALKDSIGAVDNFVMGLKQIPAWSIEAAGGIAVAAKAFVLLKNAIVATNVASLASRATPLGAALTVIGIAAVAATEALGGLANEQRDASRAAQDNISVAQQQQQQLEKQSEFADALMGAHQKLESQLANSTEGTAQYNKALENQQETEKQLTGVLGEAAVQRIKDSGWSIDAYNQEKQAFEDVVAAKRKALKVMVDDRIEALRVEKETLESAIKNYWADADNFNESIKSKAKYLTWFQELRARFDNAQAEAYQAQADELKAKAKQAGDELTAYQGDLETGPGKLLKQDYIDLADARDAAQKKADEANEAVQKVFKQGAGDLQDKLADIDKQYIDAQQQSMKLAEIPEGLKTATEPASKGGPKTAPMDTSEQIQKKLDNYNVKSIEDQAAIAQSNYKSRLDAITDATNRYGKSYAFLDQTTATMNQHVSDLQATTAALSSQLQSDLQKVNDFASATGATITMSGANDGSAEGTAWNYFTSKGYSPELTAGIIGNLMTESGMNPGVWAGDNSGSYGIGQWLGGRLDGLKQFASDMGTSIDDLNTQLAYVDYELKHNEYQAFQQISNADLSQPESSAYAVSKYYERPAYAGNPERQQNARDIYDKYMYSQGGQVNVSIPQEVLMSAGMSQKSFNKMSVDSKKEFIAANKEQIKDANLLIGYLTQVAGEQKKIADYEKQIADERKKSYETLIKGIQDIESFQNKRAELSSRESLAALGYYATDSDKAVATQRLTQSKLASSNAALAYAKSKGVDIFTDPTMSEERVKNLELQAQVQQQSTFATPEAQYKQRLAEIEYNQKLAEASMGPSDTMSKQLNNLDAANEKVKALRELLKEMKSSDTFADQTEEFKKYNLELKEAQKNAKELADTYSTKMKQGIYDVTDELLLQGKKLEDIWTSLWKKLAEDALKYLFGIKNDSPGILSQAFGMGTPKKKQQATSFSEFADLLGVTGNTWGTGSSSKAPTANASKKYDTSSWNQYADLASSIGKVAEDAKKNKDKTVEDLSQGSGSGDSSQKKSSGSSSSATDWLGLISSFAGLFHASGGVVDSPSVAGEDGEEVIIPVQKNTQNSASLLSYAAGKLGQKSMGVTADFSSKDIAKTAMNVSVNSATNMAKTNAILATQNQILTTIVNNMGQQGNQTNVIVAGGNNSPSMEDQATAYNKLKNQRYIT